jgi:transposase-like protein
MQKHYSLEAKEAIIRKILLPTSVIITDLCKETGVARSTIYKWKNDYLNKGITVPSNQS